MNSLVVVNIFIVLLHLCILFNLTTAVENLGDSSCRYSGNFDHEGNICHKHVVKLKYLPKDCTSFVFNGVTCKQDYKIVPANIPEDFDHLRSLIDFEDKSHNVFVFYTHGSPQDWYDAFFTGDFSTEAQSVKDFTDSFCVSGLILNGIEYPSSNDDDFYQKFTAYVTAIKTTNPDLAIGLYLSAKTFVECANEESDSNWFDFSTINDIMDFYIIEFTTFNPCSDDLLHGGITPLVSSSPDIMTLSQFGAALNQSTICKDKVYFEFLINPQPKPEGISIFNHCQLSYTMYCGYLNEFIKDWCVDNHESLYQKGQFARQYSKGFVARDIDLVDRDDMCNCGDKFITFTMLLNGYNNGEDINTCDALRGY